MSNYNDSPYLDATCNLPVPGLFLNFHTAATLLRVARSELKVSLLDDNGNNREKIVSKFYTLLQNVENYIHSSSHTKNKVMHEKFIIEVEGLDGSGKTSLVQSLVDSFQTEENIMVGKGVRNQDSSLRAICMKTPSSSLSDIRPLWDHRGGILARAFYFITNYILEYEISVLLPEEVNVIIIDRWYASTLAYTVAYRPDMEGSNDNNEDFSIEDLPIDIFQWPSDLHLRPHLMLVLDIDPETRQARVENRKLLGGGASRFNPWDDRLANDEKLGARIMAAMKKLSSGPLHTNIVNANGTKEEVLTDALNVVRHQYKQQKYPESFYEHDPLLWWKDDGMKLGLCDANGRRCHHALWNLQLAFGQTIIQDNYDDHPPVLKTVGLDHIDSHGVYFWSSSSSLDNDLCNNGVTGSVLCVAGSYPLQYQWRSEGFFTKVTKNECLLFGHHPPNSLLRHIAACEESVRDSNNEEVNNNYGRFDRDDCYYESVRHYLNNAHNKECTSTTISLWRFIPIRIEVLRGGPSTRIEPYPQRFEWIHKDQQWCIRSLLPFSPCISQHPSEKNVAWKLNSCTIAIMGTHTAGKTTIGNRLSELMGWRFDEELGKILREEDKLVAGGHEFGDGKSNNKDQWDELVYEKEVERDNCSSSCCRIVETWHSGNAAWNYFRRKDNLTQHEFQSTILNQYLDAMTKQMEVSSVLMIFLQIDSTDTIIGRRLNDKKAYERLPLQDEAVDAKNLFSLNNKALYEYMARAASIPLLTVDNNEHGEEAIQKTLRLILHFVQEHAFRRVVIK